MIPVAVLPVAGLLLGIGAAHFEWIPPLVSALMKASGDVVFGNLALIFAVGVAVGLTENDGVAAISAVVGYVVLLAILGVMAGVWGIEPVSIMGIKSMQTGVFGGILAGAIAATMFKRFYRTTLPPYLAFFSGKRSVPIVTALAAGIAGVVLSAIWPPIQHGIDTFSHWAAVSNPRTAATVYGFVERLLIPFGLHHIWNVPFFFEMGAYTDASGTVVHGDINRFFAGDPTAGILAGAFLFKMFCGLALCHRDVAQRQPAEPGRGRRHHDLGGADLVPHRHHRADRVRIPVRRAGAVRGARGARGLDAVRRQHARHAHGLHFFAGWHRLPGFQRLRQIRAEMVAGADSRPRVCGRLLRRLSPRHPLARPQDPRPRGDRRGCRAGRCPRRGRRPRT